MYKKQIAPVIVYSEASENYDKSCVSFQEVSDFMVQNGIAKSSIIYDANSQNNRMSKQSKLSVCAKKNNGEE